MGEYHDNVGLVEPNLLKEHGGEMSELTLKFAKLGSCGKFPNNIERDLSNLLQLPLNPLWVQLPIRDPSSRNKIILEKFPILLPHQIYHWLHDTWSCLSNLQFFLFCWFPQSPPYSFRFPALHHLSLDLILFSFLLLPTSPYCFPVLPTLPAYLQHPRKVARCQSRRRTLLATGPMRMCLSTLEHRSMVTSLVYTVTIASTMLLVKSSLLYVWIVFCKNARVSQLCINDSGFPFSLGLVNLSKCLAVMGWFTKGLLCFVQQLCCSNGSPPRLRPLPLPGVPHEMQPVLAWPFPVPCVVYYHLESQRNKASS